MSDRLRVRASEELARLLTYWKTIEFWIKRAEQINGQAVIPAINELRYASRQIFQAVKLLEKEALNAGEWHVVQKRLIIGEQYLLNADHDVCDAIISFFAENIKHLDKSYGVSDISMFFVEYPSLRDRVRECYDLIANSRGEYDERQKNYGSIRSNHFAHILGAYQKLVDAEVSARVEKSKLERKLLIAQGTINFMFWFTIITGICSFVSVPLAIYMWLNVPQEVCKTHVKGLILSYACPLTPIEQDSSAGNPSTGAIPDAPAKPPQPSETAHSKAADDAHAKRARGNRQSDTGQ
jgi:hypothetical protein